MIKQLFLTALLVPGLAYAGNPTADLRLIDPRRCSLHLLANSSRSGRRMDARRNRIQHHARWAIPNSTPSPLDRHPLESKTNAQRQSVYLHAPTAQTKSKPINPVCCQ
jgi:hypothetical protein